MTDVDHAKQAIRERVWSLLEREHATPPGVYGRIPSFFGADLAADRLSTLPVWQAARVIKAVPDTAQQPVRAHALREGKLVYMAVPKLADELPDDVITCGTPRRPHGLIWTDLNPEKIASIPVLAARHDR